MTEAEKKTGMTFDWKLEKLKQAIELSMDEKEIKNASAFLGAINESNKMQGHYAPTKTDNTINVQHVKEQVEQLLIEVKQDV